MKLYLAVKNIDYEAGIFLGVYSIKEKAEKRLEEHKKEYGCGRPDDWNVVEVEVDQDEEFNI